MNIQEIADSEEDFMIYQDLVRDIIYENNKFNNITTDGFEFDNPVFECDEYTIVKTDNEYENYYIIKYSSYVKESLGFDEGTYIIYFKPCYISNHLPRSSS